MSSAARQLAWIAGTGVVLGGLATFAVIHVRRKQREVALAQLELLGGEGFEDEDEPVEPPPAKAPAKAPPVVVDAPAPKPPGAPPAKPLSPEIPPAPPAPDEEDAYIRALDWYDSRKASAWFAFPPYDSFLRVQRVPAQFFKPGTSIKSKCSAAGVPLAIGPKSDPKIAEYLGAMDDYLRANGVEVTPNLNAWQLTVMRKIKGLSWPGEADQHPCAIPPLGLWGNVIPSIYALRVVEQMAGCPATIRNAYRAPEYNAAVASTGNSAHCWNAAIDFSCANSAGAKRALEELFADKQFAPFKLGWNRYPSGNLHLDTFFSHRCCWDP